MNFGGTDDPDMRLCTNAYMLVYIAESAKDDVLCPLSENDIPETLRERFMDEQRMDEAKRKQKEKVHLYAAIHLILEEDFYGWQGPDLCSQEFLPSRMLRVQKQTVRPKLLEDVASVLHYQPECIRLWRFQPRNLTVESYLLPDNGQAIGFNGVVTVPHAIEDNVSGNANANRHTSETSCVVSRSGIDSITLHKIATFPAMSGNRSRSSMNLAGQPMMVDLQTQSTLSAEKLSIFDYFSSYLRQVS
ncbi:unnamed protein product [Trichobilharzia regenti]|nr:unnamed protein product [Trichobilharzia regenti]